MANTYHIYTSQTKKLVENVTVTLADDDKNIKKWIEQQSKANDGYVKLLQTEQ